jgi:hypothetical protein
MGPFSPNSQSTTLSKCTISSSKVSRRDSMFVAPAIGPSGLQPGDISYDNPAGPSDEGTTAVKENEVSVEDLKQTLIDSLYGTERGLRASSETRGEIVEIIAQLEANNPTAAPTEAVNLLDGKWILA